MTNEEIAKIEARHKLASRAFQPYKEVSDSLSDVPALCATVRHLLSENQKLNTDVQELSERLIKSADRSGELLVTNGALRRQAVALCKLKANEWTGESSFAAEALAIEMEQLK